MRTTAAPAKKTTDLFNLAVYMFVGILINTLSNALGALPVLDALTTFVGLLLW